VIDGIRNFFNAIVRFMTDLIENFIGFFKWIGKNWMNTLVFLLVFACVGALLVYLKLNPFSLFSGGSSTSTTTSGD